MACTDQDPPRNPSNVLLQGDISSDSDSDDDFLHIPSAHDVGSGIDIDTIKSAKKVEHTVAHRVQAGRSILALVVDDDYLFSGLEGGDIAVCQSSDILYLKEDIPNAPEPLLIDFLW
jgi:hypothetical protein